MMGNVETIVVGSKKGASLFLKALNDSPGIPSGPGTSHRASGLLPLVCPCPEWTRDFGCSSVSVGNLTLEKNLSSSSLVLLLFDLYNDL